MAIAIVARAEGIRVAVGLTAGVAVIATSAALVAAVAVVHAAPDAAAVVADGAVLVLRVLLAHRDGRHGRLHGVEVAQSEVRLRAQRCRGGVERARRPVAGGAAGDDERADGGELVGRGGGEGVRSSHVFVLSERADTVNQYRSEKTNSSRSGRSPLPSLDFLRGLRRVIFLHALPCVGARLSIGVSIKLGQLDHQSRPLVLDTSFGICERFSVASKSARRDVASAIVRAKKRLDITDAELARRLGVTRSQVHDWVHGEHQPNLASLRRLAEMLECDLIELLGAA